MSQIKDTSFLLSITTGRVQCKCLSSQKLPKLSEWICEKLADGRWKVGESVLGVRVNLLMCYVEEMHCFLYSVYPTVYSNIVST
jgi:hypothetical protein